MFRLATQVGLFVFAILLLQDQAPKASSDRSNITVHRNEGSSLQSLAPPLADLDPRILKIFSLGKKPFVDDFFNLWMIQIFGAPDIAKSFDGSQVFRAAKTILRHRPQIETFYLLTCIVAFKDFKTPAECDIFLRTGLELFPHSLRLAMMGGYVQLFELNQPESAAAYYAIAAKMPDAPSYVEGVVEKILARNDLDPSLLTTILNDMRLNMPSSDIQSWLDKKIKAIHPPEESTP